MKTTKKWNTLFLMGMFGLSLSLVLCTFTGCASTGRDEAGGNRVVQNGTLVPSTVTAGTSRVTGTGVNQSTNRPVPAAPTGFVLVEAGTFQMGSTTGENDEKPVHTVTISKSFYMSKYEVTQKEWVDVMGTNPSNFKGDNLPVEQVSWYDAIEYCNRRSLKEGLTPAYRGSGESVTCNFQANGYRLPTEAEWEYAAKGGDKDSYMTYLYTGANNPDTVGWYGGNSGRKMHPVGTKQANSLGLYDMSGNVCEWCWDWRGDYSSASQTDPTGVASGSERMVRGGTFYDSDSLMRSDCRISSTPTSRYSSYGFRVVLP